MAGAENFPSFEIHIGGRTLQLELGKCAVSLFRKKQQVDYLVIENPDDPESVIRVFNNEDFVRWVGGYLIQMVDGEVDRSTVYIEDEGINGGEPTTFRELMGWNPAITEREEPSEWEEEAWLDVQMRKLDQEREEL